LSIPDVVVFSGDDEIEIYGYPREAFQPTDFHSATLVGNCIVIIGCLGYPADRRPGYTPVHALGLANYPVAPVATSGNAPGWIWNHAAELATEGSITVRGGEVVEDRGGKEHFRRNFEDYTLDLATDVWHRVTNRNWAQWRVRRADGKWFEIDPLLPPEAVVPVSVPHEVLPCEEEWHRARIAVEDVALELTVTHRAVEVVIEGQLPDPLTSRVVEEIRSRAEIATGQPCALERM
jgi:hypothetical protein